MGRLLPALGRFLPGLVLVTVSYLAMATPLARGIVGVWSLGDALVFGAVGLAAGYAMGFPGIAAVFIGGMLAPGLLTALGVIGPRDEYALGVMVQMIAALAGSTIGALLRLWRHWPRARRTFTRDDER